MPLFPKVTSPCPYKGNLAAVMDGDMCRMCQRQVFDLTALSDGEKRAFLAGCADEEEVCVSYRLPLRAAIAAAALSASTPAFAQDPPAAPEATVTLEAAVEIGAEEDMSDMVIIVGGIRPAYAELVEAPEDESVPELPVAYEDDAPAAETLDRGGKSL